MAAVDERARDALAERVFGMALGAYELMTVHLGDRLGLYRALAEREGATSGELAEATGTDERYVREWLEQQAVAGIVEVDDAEAPPDARRFSLPTAHAEALNDPHSLAYVTPMARFAASFGGVLPAVEEAFRTGGGVPWTEYGAFGREAQSDANRPLFANLLGQEWLPAIEDVHERLSSPPARVADVACGGGWSSIAVAKAYPGVEVDGFDLDEASIELARKNAAEAGVDDRVRFHVRDAGDDDLAGAYQLDAVATPGDEVERLMYTYSVLCCLPVGLADRPSAATGTVMRTETLRAYAAEAGFADLEVLPIENDVFRFYRLYT
jgi:hypothetical protein